MSLDEVVAHRLHLASLHLKWTKERISGYLAGYSDGRAGKADRMRMNRHDPDLHGFIESGLDVAGKDSLGYRDGAIAAEALSRDRVDYNLDRDELMAQVFYWADNGDNDFSIEDADWVSDVADDLKIFLSVMSREAWIAWFVDEHRSAVEAGRDGYGDLLMQDIQHPVVYVQYEDGRIDVWDGYHRIGAAMLKGAGTVPSIRGRPQPAAIPTP